MVLAIKDHGWYPMLEINMPHSKVSDMLNHATYYGTRRNRAAGEESIEDEAVDADVDGGGISR